MKIQAENQPPLDGISLAPLIMDRMKNRPKPMGFWRYSTGGIKVPGHNWMTELLNEQKKGLPPRDSSRLRLDAGNLDHQYPDKSFQGHAAWLDWPWKLHRVQDDSLHIKLELYNLAEDQWEKKDLAAHNTIRTDSMRHQLEAWQTSVIQSLNGKDYH